MVSVLDWLPRALGPSVHRQLSSNGQLGQFPRGVLLRLDVVNDEEKQKQSDAHLVDSVRSRCELLVRHSVAYITCVSEKEGEVRTLTIRATSALKAKNVLRGLQDEASSYLGNVHILSPEDESSYWRRTGNLVARRAKRTSEAHKAYSRRNRSGKGLSNRQRKKRRQR